MRSTPSATYNFEALSARTPQILRALLSHTDAPELVMPLLLDTVEHVLHALDALARHTTARVGHATPSTSSLRLRADEHEAARVRLDWKPEMALRSTLILSHQNR